MSAQRLNIQSNAYTCQAFYYSSHLQQPAVYDWVGVEHRFHSPFCCFSVKSHEHAPCTTIHCTCILALAMGSMPACLSRAPAHHRGQRCLPLLFFLSPSLSTRAANHHPGHARLRALDAAGDTGDLLACRGGGAIPRGPQQQADGVEDSSYLALVAVKQQKQTTVVCTWGG